MDGDRWLEAKTAFNLCVAQPPDERWEFFERTPGLDDTLRELVGDLLREHERGSPLLDSLSSQSHEQGLSQATDPDALPEIDSFQVLEKIGEGGFGVVYLAQQQEPVTRLVALKMLKVGLPFEEDLVRFEAEQQALALMNHPSVARVFDAGTTHDGQPYFVMELVSGLPLVEHCDSHDLDVRQRLELFIRVCEGVHHAHQKGIIHRDLKPSNVLITHEGNHWVPKIIDFGVAKALDQRLTHRTVDTGIGKVLGTLEYMSPEQADPTAQDIDTRSDVFSLGVMLYELLVGTRPLQLEGARDKGYAAILEAVRETEPVKPSSRLLAAAREGSPAHNPSKTRALVRAIRGDLDWITMKTLEKDRTLRYGSAAELAADISSSLNDEPVSAGPPDATYRIKKFVRKHRGPVTAASIIVVAITVGLLTSLWFWSQSRESEYDAKQAVQAEAARARELEQVIEFQNQWLSPGDMNRMGMTLRTLLRENARERFEGKEPEGNVGRQLEQWDTATQGVDFAGIALSLFYERVFAPALLRVESQFVDQPLVQAQLLQSSANTMREVGLLTEALAPQERALELFTESLGPESEGALDSIIAIGTILRNQGKLDQAEVRFRTAYDIGLHEFGSAHRTTIEAGVWLGAILNRMGQLTEAEDYLTRSAKVGRESLGRTDETTLQAELSLGELYYKLGRYDEAEALFRGLLSVPGHTQDGGDSDTWRLNVVNNMGAVLLALGRLQDAKLFLEEVLETRQRRFGAEHMATLNSLVNMGSWHSRVGELVEAERYFREALAHCRRTLGDEHWLTLGSVIHIGAVLKRGGRLTEAEPYLREALDTNRRVLGESNPTTINSLMHVGELLLGGKKYNEAEEIFDEALTHSRTHFGGRDVRTLSAARGKAESLHGQSRLDEADQVCRSVIEVARSICSPQDHHLSKFLLTHGRVLLAMRKFESSAASLEEAYTLRIGQVGLDHRDVTALVQQLASCYALWNAEAASAELASKAAEWQAKVDD